MKNYFFLFDCNLYKQVEGFGKGLPLGPTFVNIFMSFHETVWLSECPQTFRPVFYKRYVDDAFLLFKSRSESELFLSCFNGRHPNINFTIEHEVDGRLSFLDCSVQRYRNKFIFYILLVFRYWHCYLKEDTKVREVNYQ